MKVYRWVVLIADVILLLLMVVGVVAGVVHARFMTPELVAVVVIIAVVLGNIIFIAITWRNQRKGVGRITGVFD